MKKISYFLSFLILGLFLTGCSLGSKSSTQKSGIKVVATTDFYGEVAKAVLGNHGQVSSIINSPNVDPHDYEPTTKVAKLVAKSDLLLYNGIGYDGWAKKLSGSKKIAVGEDIMKKKDGDNEHLWYNSKTMPRIANYLADYYSKLDPTHKKEYQKNAQKYISSLTELSKLTAQIKQNSKHKLVDVSEPVFDYALDDMGYQVNNTHFSDAVEKGTDPSPSDIKGMQDDIKQRKIAFFVRNTQASDKTVDNLVKLCKQYQVPVVNVTETLPAHKNYFNWMKAQYQQVLNIQKDEK
ncbi:metal ABC transporter solute-binding protein [Liquorilactobacillus satsumensis]|uniref:ABC transporter substrate-binding protein n=1 Tax=Liquorilactobacillus satsumensis DSM 16230 = JCM 12392 TaxID=1423801 RepID=A0A0R1VBE9_9LACO|nr:metal ABC transporter solute-binding protein [Liquorilactobacillus satsumensis]KRL99179.1 ABC transporter substrate-binding protein [Liquorilactobacillus satsumensis DSM 16230 = JCM 12392]MCC7666577.1 metal ABC transporter substrate-binding protein [Liquorilactobacillus satsumensis]MCP9312893.1 metal ABC transporter solute-binding protein [Liquorilactobacillus satsumensis]MCP9329302.1 metal ABC transporter solute-binding protein [Liquorilactobacillus satsumensis]MCP9357863.1 metal ABC trans